MPPEEDFPEPEFSPTFRKTILLFLGSLKMGVCIQDV